MRAVPPAHRPTEAEAAMLRRCKPLAPGDKLPANPNEADVRIVMTELDRALSLLYLVGTSFAAEQRKRSWRDAKIAYDAALAFLPNLMLKLPGSGNRRQTAPDSPAV
jgi:hypothetical protein